jgi:L-fuconolactonase
VVFGSDWPNSVGTATLSQIVALTRAYYAGRPQAAEKFFWKNSVRAYQWVRRDSSQPASH